MAMLSETQVKNVYFDIIGGFPPAKILKELKEYNDEDKICVACTQLDGHHDYLGITAREKKWILNEWIDFFKSNPKELKALHFNSHVPKALFDAACCQENLQELRFKWGNYADLSALENLRNLKYLYIGSGASVQDITSLGKLKSLAVLHLVSFKKIEDYFPLTTLDNLEQLVIWGPMLGRTPVKDLEFLREMPNLRSISIGNVTLRKKYTQGELANLRTSLPNLYDMNDFIPYITSRFQKP